MCKMRKPIYLIVEMCTGIAYTRETDYARAIEIMERLNKSEGFKYCVQMRYD